MLIGSIHQNDIMILRVYTQNNRASKYMKKIILDREEKGNKST